MIKASCEERETDRKEHKGNTGKRETRGRGGEKTETLGVESVTKQKNACVAWREKLCLMGRGELLMDIQSEREKTQKFI